MKKSYFRKYTIKDIMHIIKHGFGKPVIGFKVIQTKHELWRDISYYEVRK